jgi:hypothetical protein
VLLDSYAAVARDLAVILGFLGTVYGGLKYAPQLMDLARITAERNLWRERAEHAERLLGPAGATAEMLIALGRSVQDLRAEVQRLEQVQIESTRYVVDVIQHFTGGGSVDALPPPPESIADDVRDALRERAQHRQEHQTPPQAGGVVVSEAP